MSTVEAQLADVIKALGIEGDLQELNEQRKSERIEALQLDLEEQRAALATEQTDLQNAQAKLDKVRASLERANKKVDELESQLTLALSVKHRAGVAIDKREATIAELEPALAAWQAWDTSEAYDAS